jgi:hypothetical protein
LLGGTAGRQRDDQNEERGTHALITGGRPRGFWAIRDAE